jgi:di/tricarboxylate transporter
VRPREKFGLKEGDLEFTLEMGIVAGISVAALALLVLEVIAADLVALLAVAAVLLTGVAQPAKALSGFANPAVHTIAAMFVISAGLLKTGVVQQFGRHLIHFGGKSPRLTFLLTILTVVVLSAFINNTPIVVMMIPVTLGLSKAHGIAPSKLLIPISYASIMGGCCTLIGTSTNLVVSGMAARPFTMFEMAPLGVILAVVGIVYLTVLGQRLLPDRETVTSHVSGGQIREFVTELVVREGSNLIGSTLAETVLGAKGKLQFLQLIRGERIFWAPSQGPRLQAEDIIIAKGPANEIFDAGRTAQVELIPDLAPGAAKVETRTQTLAEIVIAPGSRLEGASIGEIGFRRHFNVAALAIERHGKHRERDKVVDTELRVGDVVLVQGDADAVEQLKSEEGMILLEGVEKTVVHRDRAPVAVAIAVAVVLGATFSPLPVVACAVTGAILMVLTGCLSARQLYRNLDLHTLVLIAGMVGLGVAAAETGTAKWAALNLLKLIRPLGPVGALAAMYLFTNVVTEFLSNAAAAVLMTPLAISTAAELGVSERPFVIAVAFAASASFSTPVGYQTNTIVYGPGGYKFSDYTKVGAPLNILFLILATLLIPVFWPF